MASVIEAEVDHKLPRRYEVVNGNVVEVPPMSGFAAEIANRIRDELVMYGRTSNRGRTRNDMLFRLPLAEDRSRNRQPDVTFISFDRWPLDRLLDYRRNPVDVVPELAVEVASPTDRADALFSKAMEYIQAGVLVVWVILPRVRQAYIFEPGAVPRPVDIDGALDGGAAFNDLSIRMAGLFPPGILPET